MDAPAWRSRHWASLFAPSVSHVLHSIVSQDAIAQAAVVPRAYSVLASSTFAFTICFAVWTMFAILGIPLQKQLGLSETEFGLIAATPS